MAKIKMFGDHAEVIIYNVDEAMQQMLLDDMKTEGLRLQKIFNIYDKESELSALNKKRKMKVSSELSYVLAKALHYCDVTGGLYDISKGAKFLAIKSGKDHVDDNSTYKHILIKKNEVELLEKDVLIDLGSIAKGYIADRMVDFMRKIGISSGFIDARGDIRIFGEHAELIEVQHPRDKNGSIGTIFLKDKAVATSGDYNQFYGDYSRNHVLGSGDIISASVIADDLMTADALATCMLVLGRNKSQRFLIGKDVKAMLIDKDLNRIYLNSGEEEWTRSL